MKFIILSLFCSFSAFANNIQLCPKPIIVGWEKALPFQFSEKNEVKGIDIDSLKYIMSKLNCKLVFKEIPWERHLKGIESGEIDIASGANETPERAVYANFSAPYLTEYVYLYILKKNKDKFKFKDENELFKLKIKLGSISGAYLGPAFENAIKQKILQENKNIFFVNNEKQLIELLVAKRIDGFVLGEYVNNFHNDIIDHSTKMYEHYTNFMFSKKTIGPKFITEFNNILNLKSTKDELKRIRTFYNNDKNAKY